MTLTPQPQRIASIDVLRGVVILGILPMNIQFFAMVDAAFYNPLAGNWTDDTNVAIWSCMHVLLGMKDLSIFAMLFGAGIVMIDAHARDHGQGSAAVHYRRMGILLLFGLFHAYVIWYGDILYHYALAGCVVYLFRNLPNRTLLILGALCYGIMLLILYSGTWFVAKLPPEAAAQVYSSFEGSPEQVEQFETVYSGGWWQQNRLRAPQALASETVNFLGYMGWVSAGMMLVGMALFRMGVFEGRCPTKWYVMMIGAALVIGVPLLLYGLFRNFDVGWDASYSMYKGRLYSETAAPFMALGWLSAVILLFRSGRLRWLGDRLAAVGRMSLSNYLAQSLICSLVFYGHGLGLVNEVDRVGQVGITAVVWMLQLLLSPLWLSRFSFGPVEWLWRSLAYGRRQPMRTAVLAGTAPVATEPAVPAEPPTGTMRTAPGSSTGRDPATAPGTFLKLIVFAAIVLVGHMVAFIGAIIVRIVLPFIGLQFSFEVIGAGAVLAASWICLRWLDVQPLNALGVGFDRRWARQITAGLLAGLGLIFVLWGTHRTVGWAQAEMHPQFHDKFTLLIPALIYCVVIAVREELLCRGYLFQILFRRNRVAAIAITGLLFVALHVDNPGGLQPLSILNLLLAHLLYVAVYLRCRSLWPLLGLHTAWNFSLAFIFGLTISGRPAKVAVLLTDLPQGMWTANEFGPEGGLAVTLLLAVAAVASWCLLEQQQPDMDLIGHSAK